jgi:hypothetical protein
VSKILKINPKFGMLHRMPSEERILEVERATKNFMQMQYEQNKLFTKTMEEQSALLKNISHQN